MKSKISIITPFYNAQKYLSETIKSVLRQTYNDWELILINDGSTDRSKDIALSYQDDRILYFEQNNRGVASARNVGLANMSGDYFCFLDADDVLPPNSLLARLNVFLKYPNVDFVDGKVEYVNEDLKKLKRVFIPNYRGYPFKKLLQLSENCLFGNTWMIKKCASQEYLFSIDMTHAEDLFFYLTIAKGKKYDYTEEIILLYRQSENSAMKNIDGLENGYIKLIKKVKQIYPKENIFYLKLKIVKIMFLSWIFNAKNIQRALKSLIVLFNA